MLQADDVDDFLDSVSEVSRLIEGLKAGTIPPDYVDSKLAQKQKGSQAAPKPHTVHSDAAATKQVGNDVSEDAMARETARQAELQRKVDELKANRERKHKARQQYQEYTQEKEHQKMYATDYTKWDLWCPSDEEDDLFNSITPNTPQFKAMEKDINERHNRMVEQRQIAERQRQRGNEAFKAKQYSEALRCYELGLESQRHSMALHANAAAAALKMQCYVQALEHCDKVLHLAEVLHNTPKHPLCVKALQRRAAAYQALEQHSKAVADLTAAAAMIPGDKEVYAQLQRAQTLLEEHRATKKIKGMLAASAVESVGQPAGTNSRSTSGSSGAAEDAPLSLPSLQRIEQLSAALGSAPGGKAQRSSNDAAAICLELTGLIQQQPRCSLYFRECSGVKAVVQQILKPQDTATAAAAMRLLTAACDNATTLEQLGQHQQLLGAVLDQLFNSSSSKSADGALTAAAVGLLYTASTAAPVRAVLCQQLLVNKTYPQQQGQEQQQQQRPDKAAVSELQLRLERLWGLCCSPDVLQKGAPATQLLAVSLLSNCMLVPGVKEAGYTILQQQQQGCLARLLKLRQQAYSAAGKQSGGTSRSSSSSSRSVAGNCSGLARHELLLPEKLYGLLSNMSAHAGLRQLLAQHRELVQQLLADALPGQLATAAAPGDEKIVSAAMGCLCNLSLEPCVQQQLAAVECIRPMLALAVQEEGPYKTCSTSSISSSSSSRTDSSSSAMPNTYTKKTGRGPQLPPKRSSNQQHNGSTTAAAAAEADNDISIDAAGAANTRQRQPLHVQRAACLLSRAAKQAEAVRQLQQLGALEKLMAALSAALQASQQQHSAPASGKQKQAGQEQQGSSKSAWIESVMRTGALLTAAPGVCSSCSPSQANAVICTCCALLRHDALPSQTSSVTDPAPNPSTLVAPGAGLVSDACKGNAALCLSHFAAAEGQLWHPQLAAADAVGALVGVAAASRGSSTSRNAGIALARLASDAGMMERIRQLRGIEIIYQYVRP